MKRRNFLKFFGISAPLTGLQFVLRMPEGFQGRQRYLNLAETDISLQSGEKIFLPNNPIDEHCIFFKFSDRLSSHFPEIVSKHQTIVRKKESLIVDQVSVFRMAFDSKNKDWYIVREV